MERRFTQQSPFKLFLEKTVKSNVYLYKFAFWFKEQFLGNWFHEEDLNGIDLLAIGKEDNCIDIGANVGQSISFFKSRFHKVFAFEPNPGNYALLQKKYGKNTNIEVYNKALGQEKGRLNLYVPFYKNLSMHHTASLVKEECYETLGEFLNIKREDIHFKEFQVDVDRLDDYQLESCALIKIDAEGYESEILPGMQNYLDQDVVLLIENSKRSHAFCKQFLEERGFIEYGYQDKQLQRDVENALNYYYIKEGSRFLPT